MDQTNWRQDPDRVATMIRLGAEIQWWTCDCGAHWLEDHCGPECVHAHRQYPDWDLCNWPPEMLKYWDIWNWRITTPPVDYPDITPRRFHIVLQDVDKGIVWFDAIVTGDWVDRLRKALWDEVFKEKYILIKESDKP